MSGAGEDKDLEYDDDDSRIASPVASLLSFRAESPAGSPPNSLPTGPNQPQKSSHGVTFKFPNPKWPWKSAHRVIPFRGRQKLGPNSVIEVDAIDCDV